jgi:hypothetical protein
VITRELFDVGNALFVAAGDGVRMQPAPGVF